MNLRILCCPLPTVIAALALHSTGFANEADHKILLDGVNMINVGGTPGGLCVSGPVAFPLVAGQEGGARLPVVAASRMGKARIVAYGHDGFLAAVKVRDTGRLLLNSIRWAAGERSKPRVGLLSVPNTPGVVAFLKEHDIEATELQKGASLDGIDVLLMNGITLDSDKIDSFGKWIRDGGGMLTGVTGWGWVQLRGGNDRAALQTTCAANQLFKEAGIAFSASVPRRTAPDAYIAGGDLSLLNATAALEALASHTEGKTPLSPATLASCSIVLGDAIRSLPADDALLRPKLAALRGDDAAPPGPEHPIRRDAALQRLIITRDLEALRSTAPAEVKAHPAAAIFPGSVSADAPRVDSRTLTLDLSATRWQGTGLYAPAGEVVTIRIAPEYAGKGMAVRIGCHTDGLWHLGEWKRMPEISSRTLLKEPVTTVASPFGGLIYIDIPPAAPSIRIDVTITGAVQSPRFILGQSTTADWKKHLSESPAPWGELETKKLILSMPRHWLENVGDPEALLKFWDQVMDAQADLCGMPRERKSPERMVPDTQISAGYMHSGYPIMTHLDPGAEVASSLERLSKGNWGYYHELGHNHQSPDWTFDGTVEVTCNLFTLYVSETLCGIPAGLGHPQRDPAVVEEKIRAHLSEPDKFGRWKKDPFLALIMYDQLRVAFGWDTYKKVFSEYRTLPKEQRPKNDDDKRDQWLVRFSTAAGKNLGPFFEKWGVPTSETARQSISSLPVWMPEGW